MSQTQVSQTQKCHKHKMAIQRGENVQWRNSYCSRGGGGDKEPVTPGVTFRGIVEKM